MAASEFCGEDPSVAPRGFCVIGLREGAPSG
jgi:hypothetical protein